MSRPTLTVPGVTVIQNRFAPPGMISAGGQLIRGGVPWRSVPDPSSSPARFSEWAKGWTDQPLMWEGED